MTCHQYQQQENEETLQVMQQQEQGCYAIAPSFPCISSNKNSSPALLAIWFRTMTQWCVSVAECCQIPMEAVEIALNLLHRYTCGTSQGDAMDAEQFQLATMTCLYISCKINSDRIITPAQLEQLGRHKNNLKVADIEAMERSILHTLKWKVNPPTSFDFYQNYYDSNDKSSEQHELMDYLVQAQLQHSLRELYWMQASPSIIAIAATRNAMRLLNRKEEMPIAISSTKDRAVIAQLQDSLSLVAMNAYFCQTGLPEEPCSYYKTSTALYHHQASHAIVEA
eukprot:scaffold184_cov125-Cylindrotheca_fusiformis.AAC.21